MNNARKRFNSEVTKGDDNRIFILLILACFLLLIKLGSGQTVGRFFSNQEVNNLSWNESGLCLTSDQNGSEKGKEGMANHLSPFFFKPIPINSASMELLMTIKGIGPVMAETIVSQRRNAGPFRNPEDLLRIRGVGRKRMAYLANHLSYQY